MIKNIKSIFIILIIVAIIVTLFISLSNVQKMVVVYEGNLDKKPIEIVLKHFQDSDCGMVITDLTYASQVVAPDGKTWFFHDHGGMARWLELRKFKDEAVIWVYAKDTKKWIDGKKALYSRDDITPMNYGFGAYEKRGEKLISYDEMRLLMLRGEDLNNPHVKKQLLGDS